MARGKRKGKLEDLAGQADPRAPLDAGALLDAAKPVLKVLHEDLAARAKGSPAVTEALRKRWTADKQGQRTADGFGEWQARFIEQVAAAWLLSCVFVRTLEDRGLLGRARIAGEGAADGQRVFFELAPSLTERDYLLMVFRELSQLGAARDLFDARHNPVWMLAPSAEAAKRLLELFRTPSVEAPAFRFGQEDTRFLGDLYQDLDEGVRKRYALLQTPRFVERFILDRTLEPAIEKFGIDDVEMIDPTCGSGHFLLGGFERLLDHRLRKEPGIEVREAVGKALGAVYGVDLNPYAVAIARVRLTLAAVEKGGWRKMRDVPRLPINVVVADSLLHGVGGVGQVGFAEMVGQSAKEWMGEEFALEDEGATKGVLGRRFAAVVGNPPYITVSDPVLRERYREMYKSAFRSYSLAVPFTERFFQLARVGGRVGMITANSFMKREFGVSLIQDFLPSTNLEVIINSSGVYIPGHGTPTVLLFGSAEGPVHREVLTVLANRGEPSTPDDPERGLVWSSISEHWNEIGFENDYITVAKADRKALAVHPWTLAGGGAAGLKELIESRSPQRLSDVCLLPIGRAARIGADDIYMLPKACAKRIGISEDWYRPLVIGEALRDWGRTEDEVMIFPYQQEPPNLPRTIENLKNEVRLHRFLWPFRTTLDDRATFQGKMRDAGKSWHEYMQYTASANTPPCSIAFAFVATHNHFVLDRGGKVFKQTAPIIKLPETADEDDHIALIAYLNSSTACFWMKQMFFDRGNRGEGGGLTAEQWEKFYEFDGTKIRELPLPPWNDAQRSEAANRARNLLCLASSRRALLDPREFFYGAASSDEVAAELERRENEIRDLEGRLRAGQESLDWWIYELFGLGKATSAPGHETLPPGARGSDVSFACSVAAGEVGRRYFELCRLPAVEKLISSEWASAHDLERSLAAIKESKAVRQIETPVFKRTFREGLRAPDWRKLTLDWIADRLEAFLEDQAVPQSERDMLHFLSEGQGTKAVSLAVLGDAADTETRDILRGTSIPFLASLRFTETGGEKRAQWEHTWALQRQEDAGKSAGDTPVPPPPKYSSADFASPSYYRLRGPLDVPKERFISYPHCASTESPSPIYGWAGWNHEQRARALATLYWSRKTEEGWLAPALTPMLAGLLELLPWLHQWHADKSDDYGGDSPASYYEAFLNSQCAELGLTHDDLRAWRPPTKTRGRAPTDGSAKAPKAERPPKPDKPARKKKSKATPEPEPTPPEPPTFTLEPVAASDDDTWKTSKKPTKATNKPRKPEPSA